jgi:hypothetical protein
MAELGQTHLQNRVEIRKNDKPDRLRVLADFGGKRQHVLQRNAVLEGAFAGALNDRAIGEWIAEGDAKLNDAGTSFDGGENDVARGSEIGIAAG